MTRSLFTMALIAGATLATQATDARAQNTSAGQVVSEVAKLNQAQMAFAKKLAADEAFANEFYAKASSGDTEGAAGLVSIATGVSKGSIHVMTGGGRGGSAEEASTGGSTVFQLASFTPARSAKLAELSANICFDFGKIRGCISW
jgi:hypothetical protein